VIASTRMTAVSSRTTGVASGLPAVAAKYGAPTQNTPYSAVAENRFSSVAVGAISSISPRHWMVAAMMPRSLTTMTMLVAASATA
jgi:hypothetical protein